MKIMKRFCAFAVCLVLMLAAAHSVFAADQRVYDAAGLFTEEQKSSLESSIQDLRSHTGMDAVVVTATDKKGKSTEGFADECYYTGGFGLGSAKSGFLYLIDMEDRVTHISTTGGANDIFSDSNLDKTINNALNNLKNSDYAGGAESVISDFVGYYDNAISRGFTYDADSGIWTAPVKKRSLSPLKLLISALLSALTASGSVNSVKRKYAMKDEAASAAKSTVAALAVAGLGFAFANRQDDLIDSHTVRRALPIAPKGSGGGGSSNKPFGGSTTHTGAGGMTFGGKTGGKF